MNKGIHHTAIIDSGAELGDSVSIGEYAIVRGEVHIGDEVEIGAHVVIEGRTRIGFGTRIFHAAAIGLPPQDLKYAGEPTELIIGSGNTIREFASIHRGTATGNGKTVIGNGNLLMAFVHVAHDCCLGNDLILANAVNMGGHVSIQDGAIIGGMTAIHQFVHIGAGAMVGASSLVLQDIVPFAMVSGNPARVFDANRIGLRRRGLDSHRIDAIHKAILIATRMGLSPDDAMRRIEHEVTMMNEIAQILDFMRGRSKRGIMRGESLDRILCKRERV